MALLAAAAVAAGILPPVIRRRRRAGNKIRHACDSTEDVYLSSRLTQDQIQQLATEFCQWRAVHGVMTGWCYGERRVKLFVHYLARGGYYHQCGRAEGLSLTATAVYLHQVAAFFAETAARYIQLPDVAELPQLQDQLQDPDDPAQLDRFHVVLYIDGFIVKVQRPDGAGDAYFCGRHGKSCDSINVQYVTDKWGRVRHIITGCAGSTHDKTAASWSGELRQFLDNLPAGYVVLGDPAYRGLHRNVVTTFTGHNLLPQQQQFNAACTRLRQIVERSIGASQLKWRIQQLKENRIAAKKGVMFAAHCTVAAAVLHNRYSNFL